MSTDENNNSNNTIKVNVKTSTGSVFSVEVDVSKTVMEFKEQLAEKSNIPVEQQRLIYSGHVLKDPHTLLSYCKYTTLLPTSPFIHKIKNTKTTFS